MTDTFVDTNVLVYAYNNRSQFQRRAQTALADLQQAKSTLWISRQVLREYAAAVTRRGASETALANASQAASMVERFLENYRVAEDRPACTAHLQFLLRSLPMAGKQVHDANLVATMMAHGIKQLLTFNAADFRRFDAIIQLEPIPPDIVAP